MDAAGSKLISGLRLGIFVICAAAVVASWLAAAESGSNAWRYASNIVSVRSAAAPDLRGTTILDAESLLEAETDVPTDTRRPVLLIVTTDQCPSCDETIESVVAALSQLADPPRVILVSTYVTESARFARGQVPIQVRRIHSVEEFRARTGIVAAPAVVLIDASHDVRAVGLGVIQPADLQRLVQMIRSDIHRQSEGLVVIRGGGGVPLSRDQAPFVVSDISDREGIDEFVTQ